MENYSATVPAARIQNPIPFSSFEFTLRAVVTQVESARDEKLFFEADRKITGCAEATNNLDVVSQQRQSNILSSTIYLARERNSVVLNVLERRIFCHHCPFREIKED